MQQIRCDIVSRNSRYTTYWEVWDNGDKVYKYSDHTMMYPNQRERDLDHVQYYYMMKKVIANDPFTTTRKQRSNV